MANVKQLADDLISIGYSKLRIDESMRYSMERTRNEFLDFFRSTNDTKNSRRSENELEGYRPIGQEYSLTADRPDQNQAFSALVEKFKQNEPPNWLTDFNCFSEMKIIIQLFEESTNNLFIELKNRVNRSGSELQVGGHSFLQINHYLPLQTERRILQDPHEDGHLLTYVFSREPGIEIKVDGSYITPELDADQLLVMPGSLLTIMTGGKIEPLWHRVRNRQSSPERLSIMFFVNPSFSEPPVPWAPNSMGLFPDVAAECIKLSKQFGTGSIDDTIDCDL